MRYFFCALLFGCFLFAQDNSSTPPTPSGQGTFYVKGIVYHYLAGTDYTVVAAAHSALNHKFLAVKVRVYNVGRQSITVKPEDIVLEDANGGHAVTAVSGADLTTKMRRPYNWARFAVTPVAGAPSEAPDNSAIITPQLVEMMKAMAARTQALGNSAMPAGKDVLYTDTPGALASGESPRGANVCDPLCQLRNVEANSPDVLTQLQRQNEPDYIQENAFLANTIPPRANASGVLFCPLGKLAESAPPSSHGKKSRLVRVTVPIGAESFQFLIAVE
jgi:hypothetical protein